MTELYYCAGLMCNNGNNGTPVVYRKGVLMRQEGNKTNMCERCLNHEVSENNNGQKGSKIYLQVYQNKSLQEANCVFCFLFFKFMH